MSKNVSQILQKVHDEMKSRYIDSSRINQEIQEAKILSEFLREIKIRSYNRKSKSQTATDLKEDIYDLILDNITLPKGRTISNLFQRTGKKQGVYFEDDLAAVIASIVNLANPQSKKSTYKTFSLGAATGVTAFEEIVEEIVENETQTIVDEVNTQIEQAPNKFVMGKIDTYVKGKIIQINGSIQFPKGLLEALSNATFTDKSYKSSSWKNGKQIDLGTRIIKLGSSDPYRALIGSMSSLGFNKRDIEYIYYGGRNIIMGNDSTPPPEKAEDVKQHIYHLRYLYELTGAGIIYKNYNKDFFSGAKFLVYNDPTSMDITVLSTSAIIRDILLDTQVPNNPYGNISISSAYIKASSKS